MNKIRNQEQGESDKLYEITKKKPLLDNAFVL